MDAVKFQRSPPPPDISVISST